jgi:signal recognition particle receptor subunit beta
MVSINYAFKEISCKIVYYGPGLSGKTTNLQYVHKKIPANTKGELISLATDADRTLFFDFLPLNIGDIHGFSTKFQLYTVPGQVFYNATRKLVLRGVDGLVFVADSQRCKMDENLESLKNLEENLKEYGYDLEKLPMVLQYNKRDLPDIASLEELETQLNPKGLTCFESVATTGEGVFDTLKCITKIVLDKMKGEPEVSEGAKFVSPEMEMAQHRAERLKVKIVPGATENIAVEEKATEESAKKLLTPETAVLVKDEPEKEEIPYPEPAQPQLEKEIITEKEVAEVKSVTPEPAVQDKILAVSVKKKKAPKGFSLWGWIKKLIGK